jgi:hypothetical protein
MRYCLLASLLILSACASSSSPNGNSVPTNSDEFFQATVGSTIVTMVEGQNNVWVAFAGEMSGNWDNEGHEYYHYTGDNITHDLPNNRVTIHFMKLFPGSPYASGFDGLVYKGSMPYVTRNQERDGIAIEYVDANNHTWATDFGSHDQSGSTFMVTSHDSVHTAFANWRFNAKGTFSCTLYDSAGSSLKVSNGTFAAGTQHY